MTWLEIARGLMHYPNVLFLDEPIIGLDPQSREHIWDYIRELRKREDMTIILTTHYMGEADRLCDRIAIIDRGKVVALDTPAGLKNGLGGDKIVLGTKEGLKLQGLLLQRQMSRDVRVHDGEIEATVSDGRVVIPRVVEMAAASGIRIEYVSLRQPDMNDVFIHHTGRDLRHDSTPEYKGRMAMRRRRSR